MSLAVVRVTYLSNKYVRFLARHSSESEVYLFKLRLELIKFHRLNLELRISHEPIQPPSPNYSKHNRGKEKRKFNKERKISPATNETMISLFNRFIPFSCLLFCCIIFLLLKDNNRKRRKQKRVNTSKGEKGPQRVEQRTNASLIY